MHRRNPKLGLMEYWFKLRERGYTRHYVSLFRLMIRIGLFVREDYQKQKYIPKPYEQMSHPGERVQIDVKWVPADVYCWGKGAKILSITAIDEYRPLTVFGSFR